jgi:hypothetical protein
MPLVDHFHPPLSQRRHWHAFHNGWASSLAAALNRHLPENYFAEPNVQFGIEIDVATFEEEEPSAACRQDSDTRLWTPPDPIHTIPLLLEEDTVQVAVYSSEAGPVLVAAVELVSPSNKDRQDQRDAFLAKCETYLHQGIGLVIVDIVTNRTANLHHDLMRRLDDSGGARIEGSLYTAAYRPVGQDGQTLLQIWANSLELGATFPEMPLWLRGGPCVPVELEASYQRTCSEQRIT